MSRPAAEGEVLKEMSADSPRRIVRLTVTIRMPQGLSADERAAYERVGRKCPVHNSLGPETQVVETYIYAD